MPDEDHALVRPVEVEHPGATADARLGFLEIPEPFHALAGDHGDRHRVGERVDEPGERLLEREAHRVPVGRLHPVDQLQHVRIGVAGHGHEALDAVTDVLGRQLAAVHRRLRLPAHTPAQLEDVGRLAGLAPRFREIALDWKRPRRDGRPGSMPDEAAVGEGQGGVCLEGADQHRVEVRRVTAAKRDRPAALGRLREPGRRDHHRAGGQAAGRQQIAPCQHQRSSQAACSRPP